MKILEAITWIFKDHTDKNAVKNTRVNVPMLCASCGSRNIYLHEDGDVMICNYCGMANDRVEALFNCCQCGREVMVNTKFYKTDSSRVMYCGSCRNPLEEIEKSLEIMKELREEKDDCSFFDLYKTCNDCGKQYKVNNKSSNNGVCYSCELGSIKNKYTSFKDISINKEIKYCNRCGVEFYDKDSEDICNRCKMF